MKRHAFLIYAHDNPELLRTLLLLLDHERSHIFLHIDRRAKAMQALFEKFRLPQAAITLLPSQEVYWADISQVKVELRLFAAAHEMGGFAHYHLLSGVDMPLKPIEEILDFFDRHEGKEFVGFWNTETVQHRTLDRKIGRHTLFAAYMNKRKHLWRHRLTNPIRKAVLSMEQRLHYQRYDLGHFRNGYNWCSITPAFVELLLEQRAAILRTYRHTITPDEIYKQTLLIHSPLAGNIYDLHNAQRGTMRLIDWERGKPYVWQDKDLPELLASPCLFARKMSVSCAHALYNHLTSLS